MIALKMPSGGLATYRGWDIEVRRHKAEVGETWGVPSCFVGKLIAVKMPPGPGRPKYTVQPLWLTRGQMEMLRTDLDIESATMYLIETGLKAIKRSIDLYESGAMTPETMPAEPKDLSPRTDLKDPSLRINVGPAGLEVKPPAPPTQ
jgi:hypothetical protein